MTEKEAIELIKTTSLMRYEVISGKQSYLGDAMRMAVQALEKQMPKKPKIQVRGVYDDDSGDWICDEEWNMCPSCTIRHEVYPSWKFCHYCGQSLDWSE